ncbi:hypothetical protein [Luminiphilus syltensis]|uniref:hypothetical protein n=1 Tax=Luminiphilus syltensis TaxID=1341119 RepID=UPI0002D37BC3|nr:hypothetical protein [Luminiphilus syltensis]
MSAKYIAIALSAGMFAFSAWIYSETGDWVAILFMVLSGCYGLFFSGGYLDRLRRGPDSEDRTDDD